ncbi:unnamed protein product [Linum trigynum]|uniref:Uncharacterized protein n=1 Tax=Linum trigynum TaxID=586398 RepID=A0AAV2F9C2_9ROSI
MASKLGTNQGSANQERKGNQNRKGDVDASSAAKVGNKGKEPMADQRESAKGVLGSGPSKIPNRGNGLRPTSETYHPSNSGQPDRTGNVDNETFRCLSPSPLMGLTSSAGQASSSSASHLVKSFVGPNDTRMQIVAVPSSLKRTRQVEASSPSAGERMKKKKGSRQQSKKGTPVKLQASKALEIWSPVKDRKNKSKARLSSLTLEEINAWTCAAAEKADRKPDHDKDTSKLPKQRAPAEDAIVTAVLQN